LAASRRRAAEGVEENLAARDQRDSQRAAAPLMIALGARVINNSEMTSDQTSETIIEDMRMIKSPEEIEVLRISGNMVVKEFQAEARAVRAGAREFELARSGLRGTRPVPSTWRTDPQPSMAS
jgi:Xaa-Pro aminopeptidase